MIVLLISTLSPLFLILLLLFDNKERSLLEEEVDNDAG